MSRLQVHHDNMESLRECGITEKMLLAVDDNVVAQLVDVVEGGADGSQIMNYYNEVTMEVSSMGRSEKAARKVGKAARTGTDTAKAVGNWMTTDGKAHAKTAGSATSRFLRKAVRKSIAVGKAAKDAYREGNEPTITIAGIIDPDGNEHPFNE